MKPNEWLRIGEGESNMSGYSSSGTKQVQFVIEKDKSLSNIIDLSGYRHVGLIIPDEWTSADMTFKVAIEPKDEKFVPLYDDEGYEVTIKVGEKMAVSLDSVVFKLAPWRFVKIQSGTTSIPVAQTADDMVVLAQLKR